MALKDWKRLDDSNFRNNKKKVLLSIDFDFIIKKYDVIISTGLAGSQRRNIARKSTKIDALKYAKSYMRKH